MQILHLYFLLHTGGSAKQYLGYLWVSCMKKWLYQALNSYSLPLPVSCSGVVLLASLLLLPQGRCSEVPTLPRREHRRCWGGMGARMGRLPTFGSATCEVGPSCTRAEGQAGFAAPTLPESPARGAGAGQEPVHAEGAARRGTRPTPRRGRAASSEVNNAPLVSRGWQHPSLPSHCAPRWMRGGCSVPGRHPARGLGAHGGGGAPSPWGPAATRPCPRRCPTALCSHCKGKKKIKK